MFYPEVYRNDQTLLRLNIVAAGLFGVLLSIYSILLLTSDSLWQAGEYRMWWTFANATTASVDGAKFQPVLREHSQVNIHWFIILFILVTVVAHVYYSRLSFIHNVLINQYNEYRFLEYSISATLMMLIIAILDGTRTIASLIAVATLTVICMWSGAISEYSGITSTRGFQNPISRFSFAMGWVSLTTAWTIVGIDFWNATRRSIPDESDAQAPGWLTAIFVSQLIFFSCFGLVAFVQRRWGIGYHDRIEQAYTALSFLAKATLVILVTSGLWGADQSSSQAS